MAQANPLTLLGLPPELRNRIWEMVVYHSATDGVICPLQDAHGQFKESIPRKHIDLRHISGANPWSERKYVESMAMVSGARFVVEKKMPDLHHRRQSVHSAQITGGKAERSSISELLRLWQLSPNVKSKHFCNLDCLLQPQLAHVNVQVRAESLPLFYSTNHFHLEMSNFAVASKVSAYVRGKPDPKDQRTPVDWFEGIGSKNLRNIKRLDIVGQSSYDSEHSGVLVKYDRDRKSTELAETCGFLFEETPPTWVTSDDVEKQRELHKRKMRMLRQVLDVVKKHGLSAALVRNIVRILEPSDVRYLRK